MLPQWNVAWIIAQYYNPGTLVIRIFRKASPNIVLSPHPTVECYCRLTTEFLEKGAYVEADLIRQVKQLLPEDLAANIQEPETPASRVPEEYERPVAPISSSPGPVVTELPADVDLN